MASERSETSLIATSLVSVGVDVDAVAGGGGGADAGGAFEVLFLGLLVGGAWTSPSSDSDASSDEDVSEVDSDPTSFSGSEALRRVDRVLASVLPPPPLFRPLRCLDLLGLAAFWPVVEEPLAAACEPAVFRTLLKHCGRKTILFQVLPNNRTAQASASKPFLTPF